MSTHLSCNDIVTFSKLHMLSRYNDYMGIPDNIEERTHQTNLRSETIIPQQRILLQPTQFGISYPSPSVLAFTSSGMRRPRGEKKPIPEELKDERYFERRKRNNQAAKKSRDARRMREDQIAFRATVLEQENAVLRAQVLTLKEEAHSLRQLLLLQRKTAPYVCLPTNPS